MMTYNYVVSITIHRAQQLDVMRDYIMNRLRKEEETKNKKKVHLSTRTVKRRSVAAR